jgi:hypothetical protein
MLVWGYGVEIRTRTLDVQIRRLLRIWEFTPHRYFETVFGVAYRFKPDAASGKRDSVYWWLCLGLSGGVGATPLCAIGRLLTRGVPPLPPKPLLANRVLLLAT